MAFDTRSDAAAPIANLPGGINQGDLVPKEYQDWMGETDRGETGMNSLAEGLQPAAAGRVWDPRQNYQQWQDIFQGDPRMQAAQGRYDRSLDAYGQAGQQFNQQAQRFLQNDIGQLRQQAYGQGPSYAEQYGAAQRQQAQGDIAKQATMGARGRMNPAVQRAAVMQSSNMGANMASQIAAARTQERQAAMQQYLQARQAQLQARGQGVDALGNVQAAGGQALGREDTYQGGVASTSQTTTAQQAPVFLPQ